MFKVILKETSVTMSNYQPEVKILMYMYTTELLNVINYIWLFKLQNIPNLK